MNDIKLKAVFAIANKKGGVGKTTSAQNIAAGLVKFHKPTRSNPDCKVLVIDLDEQKNISYLLGWDKKNEDRNGENTIYAALRDGSSLPVYRSTIPADGKTTDTDTERKGIWYCPASRHLATVDADLRHHMNSKTVLCKCFNKPLLMQNARQRIAVAGEDREVRVSDFDYVIIDCPPSISELTYNALAVATDLIIPLQLESMSIQGFSEMMETYNAVKDELNPHLEVTGILKVMTTDRLSTAKGFSEWLKEHSPERVFFTRIRRADVINQSQAMRQSIFEYKPHSLPAIDYENLVKEIVEITNN